MMTTTNSDYKTRRRILSASSTSDCPLYTSVNRRWPSLPCRWSACVAACQFYRFTYCCSQSPGRPVCRFTRCYARRSHIIRVMLAHTNALIPHFTYLLYWFTFVLTTTMFLFFDVLLTKSSSVFFLVRSCTKSCPFGKCHQNTYIFLSYSAHTNTNAHTQTQTHTNTKTLSFRICVYVWQQHRH